MNTLLSRSEAPARNRPRLPALRKPRTPLVAPRIADVRPQSRVVITGTIRSPQTISVGSGPAYLFTLVDGTGELNVLFLGRPTVLGLLPGTRITVEGRVGTHDSQFTIWNPRYTIEPAG